MKWLRFQIWYHVVVRANRWNEKLQRAVVWRAPRWFVKWAVIRAYSNAWHDAGDKTPDELTYREVYDGAVKGRAS